MTGFIRKLKRRKYLIVTLVILIVVGFGFWYLNRPTRKTTLTIPSTGGSNSSQSQSSNNSSGATTSTQAANNSYTAQEADKSAAGAAPTNNNLSLVAPSGSFVSNHYPGQNGSSNAETSTCNTTPGASCYIKFVNGGLTRTLETKTADSNGSVIWSWNLNDAGFTSGSWQITAIASSGSQTKSVNDSQALVVQ